MKIFVGFVLLMILFSGFIKNSNSDTAEDYAPTAAQRHFTAIIKSLPGVVSAEWKSPISLWVRASAKAVGSPPNVQTAKQLADMLAERGRTALRQPFCVHIYQVSTDDLAKSCVY